MEYGESVTKIAGIIRIQNTQSIRELWKRTTWRPSLKRARDGYLAGMLAASMSKTGKIGSLLVLTYLR